MSSQAVQEGSTAAWSVVHLDTVWLDSAVLHRTQTQTASRVLWQLGAVSAAYASLFPLAFPSVSNKNIIFVSFSSKAFFVMNKSMLLINSICIHSHKLPLHTHFVGSVYVEEKNAVAVNEQNSMTIDHLGSDSDFVWFRCTESIEINGFCIM